jgi:hypothetical protein
MYNFFLAPKFIRGWRIKMPSKSGEIPLACINWREKYRLDAVRFNPTQLFPIYPEKFNILPSPFTERGWG